MTKLWAAAVFLLFTLLFGWRVEEIRLGTGYLDPVGKIQAQDEAVYSSAAIRMAEQGGWMTPVFMDRFFLYKPPLLYWLSGASARLFGVRNRNLRLPSILAAAAICTFAVWHGGWLAAALLATNPLFFIMARRNMTDAILTASITALAAVLWSDSRLERLRSCLLASVSIAAAILVKQAGAIPLAMLVLAGLLRRAPIRRLVFTAALAIALAAPWFVYQYQVNQRWFWTEFVEIELLAYGAGAPPQASAESGVEFYARRLWGMDPWLCLLAIFGAARMLRSLRCDPRAQILVIWLLLMVGAITGYQYRNATYLLPVIPVLAMIAVRHVPVSRQAGFALGTGVLVLRLVAGDHYSAVVPPGGFEVIEQRCEQGRGNDLVVVGGADQFYATVLPMARVRYALPEAELPPKGFALDFRSMGIIIPADEYSRMATVSARYADEMKMWGLPTDRAAGTVIAYRDAASLARMVAVSEGVDFVVSEAAGVPPGGHEIRKSQGGFAWLASPQAIPVAPAGRSCRM